MYTLSLHEYTLSLHEYISFQFKTVSACCIKTFIYSASIQCGSRQVSPFHRPRRPLGRVEVQLYSILDLCTRRGRGVSVTPWQHLTPGEDPVPIAQEAGWASGPVWTGAENLGPPGFDPRTVQPVGSRYTDYATRPTSVDLNRVILM